jgi:hypothetical protein
MLENHYKGGEKEEEKKKTPLYALPNASKRSMLICIQKEKEKLRYSQEE